MKVSKRGEYALRALIDFGLAQALGRPLLQVSELASKEDLPVKFLEQILMQLKAGGYLESRRGRRADTCFRALLKIFVSGRSFV